MLKKTILLIFLLFVSVMSANAVTYLNSCGQNSGWINSETYIINFTNIPNSYTTSYCFRVNQVTTGITFEGNSNSIINENPNPMDFFEIYRDNQNMKIQNLNIDVVEDFINVKGLSGINGYYQLGEVTNISIDTANNVIHSEYLVTNPGYFRDNILTNIKVENANYIFLNNLFGFDMILTNDIYDSKLISNKMFESTTAFGSMHNDFFNSVIILNDDLSILTNRANDYFSSLVAGYLHVDSDDNNVADADIYTRIYSAKILIQLGNEVFIQDINEGNELYTAVDGETIFLVNNEEIPLTQEFTFGSGASNNQDMTLNCQYINELNISTTQVNLFSNNYMQNCNINSNSNAGVTPYENSDISFNTGAFITNNIFVKSGTQQSYIIAPEPLQFSIYLIVENNSFDITSTPSGTMSYIVTNAQLTNRIVNNSFDSNANTTLDFITILAETPTKVNQNIFENTNGNSETNIFSSILVDLYNVEFYNNYIDDVVLNIGEQNINLSSFVAYEHTDNKIYYWNLGNYYVSNAGCTDTDIDGICDSPFVFNSVIDNYPLSSYPFDFTTHLLQADAVADNVAFNVNFSNFISGESINLTTLNGGILFDYFHNSGFIDLQCDFWVNAINVDSSLNVPVGTQTFIHNDWIEGDNQLFINCYNDFRTATTGIFNLSVALVTTPPIVNVTEPNGTDLSLDLLTGDIAQDSNSFIEFLRLFNSPLGMFLFLGMVFVGFAGFMLVLAIVRFTIR